MTIGPTLRRALGRVAPSDVTVVLTLDARRLSSGVTDAPPPPAGITVHLLDEATVRAEAAAGAAGFARAVPDSAPGENGCCVTARHADGLVAHAWLARSHVPAALNTGGTRFAGIGLCLPARTAYVYKVHVAPHWRGRGLAAALIAHGARTLPGGSVDDIVTTTDVDNAAFRRAAARLGFHRRDWAAEIVLGGRSRFRLPRPVAVRGGHVTFRPGTSERAPLERG